MSQNEKTYLSPELKIEGSIECVNGIEIYGEVLGSITCQHDVLIDGHVEGEISGRNITIRNHYLNSNIHATGNVAIEESTDYNGNIEAKNIIVNGVCIGNIQVEESISVGPNAWIQGNIDASNMKVKEGAKINGIINILKG